MKLSHRDLLLALSVALVWGANFAAIRVGLGDLPPLLYSALRFSLVALPMALFVGLPRGHVKMVIQIGVLLGLFMFGGLFLALDGHATVMHAAIIVQAQVPLTTLLSVVVLGRRLHASDRVGIGIVTLGLLGLVLSSGPSLSAVGVGLLSFSALTWALANLVFLANPGVNMLRVIVWAFAIPPLPLFAASFLLESSEPLALISASSATTWLALAFMAFGSTLFAYAAWGSLIQRNGAARVVPFALLIPVFASLVSMLVLASRPPLSEVVFAAVALLGLAVCIFRPDWRKLWTRSDSLQLQRSQHETSATKCCSSV